MNRSAQVDAYFIFAMQMVAIAATPLMLMFAQPWQWLIAFLVYFVTGCCGMTMLYHRWLSHRSWACPRWFEVIFSTTSVIALTGSSIGWVAIHREHHQFTDQQKDPHSPHHRSFWFVQFGSMFHVPKIRLVTDLLRDPLHSFLHRHYIAINLGYAALLYLLDPLAVVYAYLFPAMLCWHMGSAINSVGHILGYRNHETRDRSRNNAVLAALFWGEGWHNNHHANPKSPYFGQRWFEFDVGGALIRQMGG